MMNLTIMGLTPGPLVRVLFPLVFTVGSVSGLGYSFFVSTVAESKCNIVAFFAFLPI